MSDVKRYTPDHFHSSDMRMSASGPYVMWTDYDAKCAELAHAERISQSRLGQAVDAEVQIAALRAELADLRARYDQAIINCGHHQTERNVARAEVERLRAESEDLLHRITDGNAEINRLRAALTQCNEHRADPHKIIGIVDAALAGMPPYDFARAALAADQPKAGRKKPVNLDDIGQPHYPEDDRI